mmetsp:Transcript_42098/g.105612  ORF Transcript_42098/g.105612 Transcript_42098/m.105612 type:complete len:244 (+) Transcript_42098:277-1008(+)
MAAASASTVRVTASAGRPRCCRPARRSATITTAAAVAGPLVPPRCRLPGGLGVAAAAAALLMAAPQPAEALKIPPVSLESAEARCKISTLDKFADTRAKFSLEASSGAMDEALVDVRGCDFHGQDLSSKVFSGVLMDGINLQDARLVGVEMSRAIARSANLAGIDLTDANAYSSIFDGSDLRGAQFENAVLSSASFGRDASGTWANLEGAHFEGALLSSSDVGRVCENPTLSSDARKYELGCR